MSLHYWRKQCGWKNIPSFLGYCSYSSSFFSDLSPSELKPFLLLLVLWTAIHPLFLSRRKPFGTLFHQKSDILLCSFWCICFVLPHECSEFSKVNHWSFLAMELYIKVFVVSIRKLSSLYLLPCSFLEYSPFYYLPNASLYPYPPFSYSLDPFSDLFPATSPCSSPSAPSLRVYHWRAHELVTVPPDSLSTPAPPADETPFRYPLRNHRPFDLCDFIASYHLSNP